MKFFRTVLCFFLIAVISFTLSACSHREEKIDWQLYGAWISQEGEVGEPVEFTISGDLKLEKTETDSMQLDITFPHSFPYSYNGRTEFTSESRKYFSLPYCVSTRYAFNQISGEPVFSYLALCPEKEYVIFCWEDHGDSFVIASTDPETDYQEILDYFEAFFEKYNIGT